MASSKSMSVHSACLSSPGRSSTEGDRRIAMIVTLCPLYPSMARRSAPTLDGLVMAAKCLTFGAAIAPRRSAANAVRPAA